MKVSSRDDCSQLPISLGLSKYLKQDDLVALAVNMSIVMPAVYSSFRPATIVPEPVLDNLPAEIPFSISRSFI